MCKVFNHEFYRISQISRIRRLIINFTNTLKQSFKGEFHEFLTLNETHLN